MRARARAFCEDSRRRVLEDDTSSARVDVFRARMCSFCLPSGVVRGGSLVGEKELSKETQRVMEREKVLLGLILLTWGTFLFENLYIFFLSRMHIY